jgi:hypothetical protein
MDTTRPGNPKAEDSRKITVPAWKWRFSKGVEGPELQVSFSVANASDYKVTQLAVKLTAGDAGGRALLETTSRMLFDQGMDFAPAQSTTECSTLVALRSIRPAEIRRISIAIVNLELHRMTEVDVGLCEVFKVIGPFYNSERETMTAQEAAAEKVFNRLMLMKQQEFKDRLRQASSAKNNLEFGAFRSQGHGRWRPG